MSRAPRKLGIADLATPKCRFSNLKTGYVTVERAQGVPDPERAMPAICEAIRESAVAFLGESFAPEIPDASPLSMLSATLNDWAAVVAPKPLVGMRDLRDYLIQSKDGVPLTPGSPFNIKEDSANISNFSRGDIRTLALQHTTATGQAFSDEALAEIWEQTGGQPWLTNAILKKCTWTLCPKGEPVELEHIRQAREMLIQERAVHLDSLVERLKDPRIKRIVELIITGETDPNLTTGDDFLLAQDLGLVTKEGGAPRIANPMYKEVIARVLSQGMQDAIPPIEFRWQNADGTLDMQALLREFQLFWRERSEIWEVKTDYPEAFPHLLVMALLQRVVNGGGRIEREYAAGRGRVDLAVFYEGACSIIEIKVVSTRGREATVEQGLTQIERYRALIDPAAPAFLVVFDRTPAGRERPWEERLSWETRTTPDGAVTVVGG